MRKKYPELKNGFPKLYNEIVPKSRGILIHVGNEGDDTEGCLLPGVSVKNKGGKVIGVSNSFIMFYKLTQLSESFSSLGIKGLP